MASKKSVEITEITTVELKNYREAGGDETVCFEASLYINGNRVAVIGNSGTGGTHHYHWIVDRKHEDLFHNHVQKLIKEGVFNDLYEEYLKDGIFTREKHSIEKLIGVDEYINYLIEELSIKKKCKKHLAFTLKSDEYGSYRTANQPYSAASKRHVLRTYGDQIKEILNERYVTPVQID